MDNHGQSFTRADRLLTARDFKAVFDGNERRASNRYALILARPSATSRSRLGLVIAKKHVKLACQRNRIKRQVREFFRCQPLQDSWDLVFLARKGLSELSNDDIRAQLQQLWRRLEKREQSA